MKTIPIEELREITQDRLRSWGERLVENSATPVLLIGVGHGDRSGQLDVCLTEDFPQQDLVELIGYLYHEIVLHGRGF